MFRSARFLLAAVFVAAIAVPACSSSNNASVGNTFACGSSLSCTTGSQYCLKVESSTSYSCVDLPSGCTAATACSTCLASVPNEEACADIGGDIEVDVTS